MHRRVVFALAALPLSGSLVAYGPDAAPLAKALTGAPGTRMTGGTASAPILRAAARDRTLSRQYLHPSTTESALRLPRPGEIRRARAGRAPRWAAQYSEARHQIHNAAPERVRNDLERLKRDVALPALDLSNMRAVQA